LVHVHDRVDVSGADRPFDLLRPLGAREVGLDPVLDVDALAEGVVCSPLGRVDVNWSLQSPSERARCAQMRSPARTAVGAVTVEMS
jgi:hypothetical protein